ncbi:hypothetical protein OROMI_012764 [Orobanche minor]
MAIGNGKLGVRVFVVGLSWIGRVGFYRWRVVKFNGKGLRLRRQLDLDSCGVVCDRSRRYMSEPIRWIGVVGTQLVYSDFRCSSEMGLKQWVFFMVPGDGFMGSVGSTMVVAGNPISGDVGR